MLYYLVGKDLMYGECQGKALSSPSWAIYTITLMWTLCRFNPGIKVQYVEDKISANRLADSLQIIDEEDVQMEALRCDSDDDELPQMMSNFQ